MVKHRLMDLYDAVTGAVIMAYDIILMMVEDVVHDTGGKIFGTDDGYWTSGWEEHEQE